jgi:small-conductance mechanosensitive channel
VTRNHPRSAQHGCGRPIDAGRAAARRGAIVLACAVFAFAASAQPSVGLPAPAAPAASSAAVSLQSLLERAQADADRLAQQPDSAALIAQRRDAADRLLSLLRGREATPQATSADPAASAVASTPSPRLGDKPPYSVLEVDRLRDQRDALVAQRSALQLALKSLDGRMELAAAAQRKAQEGARALRESLEGQTDAAAAELARAKLDLADLEARTTEQELAVGNSGRTVLSQRLEQLAAVIANLDAQVARAATSLRLSDDELAAIEKRLNEAQAAVARERRALLARMAASAKATPGDGASVASILSTLAELEGAYREQFSLWQLRRSVIDAAGRTDVLRDLGLRVTQTSERLQASLALAEQQVDATRASRQVESNDDASARLLRAQRDLRDVLRESVTLLRRTQQEADAAGRPSSARGWFKLAWERAAVWANDVWDFELFAASDTVQVDGRSVTLSRGVTVGKSVGLLLIVGIGYGLARLATRGGVGWLARRGYISAQAARVAGRWVMWLLMLVVVLAALRLAHIPVTAFAFLGGALALGFGFGAQNVLKNFISGVIILFERKIRVGDILTVGGVSGTVSTIDLRATTLRGFDGIDTVMPNSVLLEGQVNNWNLGSPMVRRSIALGLAHGTDMRQAMQIVGDCARGQEGVLGEPAPNVLFEDFGAGALVLRLQYWVRLGGPLSGPEVDSLLRLAISDRLGDANIVLAAP